jgi:hypothetical protein
MSLLAWVEKSNPGETSLETMAVLQYELGDLAKCFFYAKIRPWNKEGYEREARTTMSDLLTQVRVVCEREGWNFDKLYELGEERMIERIQRKLEFKE